MFLIAFSIFIFIASVLGLASVLIALHFSRYGAPGDKSKLFATILLAGNGLFFVVAFMSFISIPWDTIIELVKNLPT